MKLPQIKSKDLTKILVKRDFKITRQVGSHVRLHGPVGQRVTIPMHNKPLAKGTLASILRQAEITVEELLELMK